MTTDGFKEFILKWKTLQVICLSLREQLVDYVVDTSVVYATYISVDLLLDITVNSFYHFSGLDITEIVIDNYNYHLAFFFEETSYFHT